MEVQSNARIVGFLVTFSAVLFRDDSSVILVKAHSILVLWAPCAHVALCCVWELHSGPFPIHLDGVQPVYAS